MNEIQELALTIIHAGYSVIPCYPRGHEKAKAPMGDKVPKGYKDAKKEDVYALRWFMPTIETLIGIPCEDNGFFAVDVDPEGVATWQAWCKEFGTAEPGPWQKTPRGGIHVLYRLPKNQKVPNNSGKLAIGIDLRSAGYICTGKGYEWQVDITEPIPEAPEWLLKKIRALLAPAAAMPELTELAGKAPDNPDAVLSYWFDKYTDEAREGTRDDCAYRLGLQLYRSHIPVGTALNLGLQYIQTIPQPSGAPYTQAEYARAIRSAYGTMPKEAATLPREVTSKSANLHNSISQPAPVNANLREPKQPSANWQKVSQPAPVPVLREQAGPGAPLPDNMGVENVINEGKNNGGLDGNTLLLSKIESLKTPDKPKATPKPKPVEKAEKSTEFSTWADSAAMIGPIEWEWPGWLSKGFLHIVVGMTGEGKSKLALRIAGVILIGLDWPDGTPYEDPTACVVWCEAEAGQAMNLDRANFMNLPMDKIYSPLGDPLGDFKLNDPDHQAGLTALAMRPDVKLIIVDSLSGADPTAEKSTEDAKNVNWLAALARDTQKPIILTHHLRKRGLFDIEGEVSLDRVRGISTILQYARVIWAIDTPDLNNKNIKRLSVIKSNLAEKPKPIGFTINDEITFTDAPEKPHNETRVDQAADLLLSLLEKEPKSAASVLDEFEQAGFSKSGLYRAKDALGVVSIRKDARWLWSLPHKDNK